MGTNITLSITYVRNENEIRQVEDGKVKTWVSYR